MEPQNHRGPHLSLTILTILSGRLIFSKSADLPRDWALAKPLYVTVEPCPMCSGAIVNSRIDRVVYGCPDVKAGGAESIFNIITNPNLNHCAEVVSGVCEEECAGVMKEFFKRRRKENKERKQVEKTCECCQ